MAAQGLSRRLSHRFPRSSRLAAGIHARSAVWRLHWPRGEPGVGESQGIGLEPFTSNAPNARRARAVYARIASSYDRRLGLGRVLHRRAVEALDPQPGDVILDPGCGTGLAFPLLEERIGRTGNIIGIELSEAMAAEARARADARGWHNIEVIVGPVEETSVSTDCDGAVLVLTHDIMRSPEAVKRVVSAVRPGGRVVAVGSKWASPWLFPLNAYVWLKARRYITTFEGFDRPWTHLETHTADVRVTPMLGGVAYICRGIRPPIKERQ